MSSLDLPLSGDVLGTYQRSWSKIDHQIFILKYFSSRGISHGSGFRFKPREWHNAIAEPSLTPFPVIDVVGRPPTSRRIAFIVDIPADACNSEYEASMARFHTKRTSGHLSRDRRGSCCHWVSTWAYRHAKSAGEMRCLAFVYCARKELSSSSGRQGLIFLRYLVQRSVSKASAEY